MRRVAEAVHRIETNGLEKVVLGRSVTVQAADPIDAVDALDDGPHLVVDAAVGERDA